MNTDVSNAKNNRAILAALSSIIEQEFDDTIHPLFPNDRMIFSLLSCIHSLVKEAEAYTAYPKITGEQTKYLFDEIEDIQFAYHQQGQEKEDYLSQLSLAIFRTLREEP